MGRQKRIAVILASHGEAETGRFAENYRVSLHTLAAAAGVMPIPVPLQHLIALSSSLKKRLGLMPGGSGSPQNSFTRLQAAALQRALDAHPIAAQADFQVIPAHSASLPYVEQTVDATAGYDGQVVVPMAPVDNALACGRICSHIAASRPAEQLHRVRVVGRLWSDVALDDACLEHLFGTPRPQGGDDRKNALLLLFHGTLVRDGKGAEPAFHTGRNETAEFASRLASRIMADPRNRWAETRTAYLNHDVGGEWTRPSFETACRELFDEGFGRVSLFPAGYFSDGNETLYRAAELSSHAPGCIAEPIPGLNDSPAFIAFLAGRVAGAVAQILGFSGEDATRDARDSHEEAILNHLPYKPPAGVCGS